MNSHKYHHPNGGNNNQKESIRERVSRFFGLEHTRPLVQAVIAASAIAGLSGIATASKAIVDNRIASVKNDSAPITCSDSFEFRLPRTESIVMHSGSGMDIWWQGDMFAASGIKISERIEEAKIRLNERLKSGEEKYRVSGLPLGKNNSGFTTVYLAALDLKTNEIEVITIVKNGTDKPRSVSHEGFDIKLVTPNGVNSGFEVVKPKGYVGLALKAPVYYSASSAEEAARHGPITGVVSTKPPRKTEGRGPRFFSCWGKVQSGVTSLSSAVYVPIQPEFAKSKELVTRGAGYLKSFVETIHRNVPSHMIPSEYRSGRSAISPEILLTMILVERTEPSRFIHGFLFKTDPGIEGFRKGLKSFNLHNKSISFSDGELQKLTSKANKIILTNTKGASYIVRNQRGMFYVYDLNNSIEALIFEILATLGANGPDSFRHVVSTAGARGIGQFMPEPYCGTLDNFGENLALESDFFEGTRDHIASVTLQMLHKVEALSKVWRYVGSTQEDLVVTLASCYNHGWPGTKNKMSRNREWAGSYLEPWGLTEYEKTTDSYRARSSFIKTRINALKKQINGRNKKNRAAWKLELSQLNVRIQREDAELATIQRQFRVGNPLVPDETLKYVREAAAVFKTLSEMKSDILADTKTSPPPK